MCILGQCLDLAHEIPVVADVAVAGGSREKFDVGI